MMNKPTNISAIIVDDEPNNCQYLKNKLNQNHPNITIIDIAHNALNGVQLITKHKPQLIFLDIKMPGGSGFDMLDAIPNRNFEVIFTTAFDEYAIKAIRFCAFDYLLKPLNDTDLNQAIERVSQKITSAQSNLQEQWETLDLNNNASEKRIGLPSSDQVLFVKTKEIIRCKGDNNYTHVYLIDGSKVLVSRTLKEFEELLSDEGFLRVHQSHLVNKSEVKAYVKTDGGYLLMHDKSQVSISRMRKDTVVKALGFKL